MATKTCPHCKASLNGCFLCQNTKQVPTKGEALSWYRLRKHIWAQANGNHGVAHRLFREAAAKIRESRGETARFHTSRSKGRTYRTEVRD